MPTTSNALSYFNSNAERIDPLYNSMFIRIFGSEDSKTVTRSLINAIFKSAGIDPIDEIDRITCESTDIDGSVECRSARYDVFIETKSDRYIDLEAQKTPERVGDRSMFYASRILSSRTDAGTTYDNLPQVIVITLLDAVNEHLAAKDIVTVGRMNWNTSQGALLATDRVLFVLVEVKKFRERYNKLSDEILNDDLLSWLYLLIEGFRHEEEMKRMIENIPTMEEFAAKYGYSLQDPDLQMRYWQYTDGFREYDLQQKYWARMKQEAVEEGHAEGRAEGLAEGRAEGLAEGLAEGRAEGLAEGRAAGLEEGLRDGLKTGREELAAKLRELGVDETLIQQALDDVQ